MARAVPHERARLGDLAQIPHLVEPVRAREGRQVRGDEREIERAPERERGRSLDHAGVPREPRELLGARTQVCARCRGEPPLDVAQAAPCTHRGDGRGELAARRPVIVHVVRRDEVEVRADRELDQRIVARRVERVAVVPQFDHHVGATEARHEVVERAGPGPRPVALERRRHGCFATPGEHHPMIRARATCGADGGELIEGGAGCTLFARELRLAQRAREARVAHRVAGEHHQVLALGVGLTRFVGPGDAKGDLGSEDRG